MSNPARTDMICELFSAGRSYNMIAAELGMTKNAVAGIIHRNRDRLPPAKSVADPNKDAAFCEALANGASIAGAGRVIGIGRPAATERFKRIRRELGVQAV